MIDVHFGSGNIGRGFIGETLFANGFKIDFVDVNETIIDAINEQGHYTIEFASPEAKTTEVSGILGINNAKDPEKVVEEISNADMVTTAIGPNILKIIAPLIAQGIEKRQEISNTKKIDVIACENMIGGSQHLKDYVYSTLSENGKKFANQYVGFPNAAVDRIVPMQHHENPLTVSVEPFKEWVVDESQMANPEIKLEGVMYVPDLEPYIERKLFSVNTGHATVAYTGNIYGFTNIADAIKDERVIKQLQLVLEETGNLLINKWNFNREDHLAYQAKIIERFKNPYISDDITRVGRTPIRKLGYDERFVRPMRELDERGLEYKYILETLTYIYRFDYEIDAESVKLQDMLQKESLKDVVTKTTGLPEDSKFVSQIVSYIQNNN